MEETVRCELHLPHFKLQFTVFETEHKKEEVWHKWEI
jgi:hypothetical protein